MLRELRLVRVMLRVRVRVMLRVRVRVRVVLRVSWVSGYKNQIIEEIGKGMEEYVLCIHL